jgi:hypothetical protein
MITHLAGVQADPVIVEGNLSAAYSTESWTKRLGEYGGREKREKGNLKV